MTSSSPNPDLRITVCACTYKRPDGLKQLLAGIAEQKFETISRPDFDIVISDNEGSAESQRICEDFQDRSAIPLRYLHEPRRGISHARNACLENIPAESDFFAMIDDDEIPEPDWLEQLILAQRDTGSDVVLGRVLPKFTSDVPDWFKEGGFLGAPSRRPRSGTTDYEDLEELGGGATNNVLVRCSAFRQMNLRFDPARGLTGGSDSLFFRLLKQAGYRIVFSTQAKVWETIPPERATLGYLLRSEYRGANLKLLNKLQVRKADAGKLQTAGMVLKIFGRGFYEIALGSFDVVRSSLRNRLRMDGIAMGTMRIANGCGMLTSIIGLRYEHYR